MSISTAERLAAGDQAAADHQQRRDEAERDDRADEDPELAAGRAAASASSITSAGHPDERDLRRLRPDGEDDRDDQRRPCTAAGSRAGARTSGGTRGVSCTLEI